MDTNNVVGVPSIAKNVRILLVDPDTTSLMLLATQLEHKQYKVTTTESAIVALSMLRERKGFYNVVLADYHMPEMSIFMFVQKIRRRCPTTPVLLMATDTTVNITTDAILKGVSFFFTKPLRDRDVTDLWQHVVRVIGKLPDPLDDTRNYYLDYLNILRNRNPSGGSSSGSSGAQNRKWWNSKRKSPTREYRRRGKNHVLEDLSDSSESESDEEKEKIKRPRMCWTPSLHARFLQAIDILGEEKSYPKALLRVINEPGLTHRQVASHLQKHRDRKRKSASLHAADERQELPPIKLPTSVNENFQGRNIFPIINHPPAPKIPSWLNAPSFVCYNVESVKQKLDTLQYTENSTLIDNRGVQVQVSEGDGTRGQLTHGNGPEALPVQGINQNYDKSNAYEEQVPWFSQNLSHINMRGDNVIVNPNSNQEQVEDFSSIFGQVTMTCDNVIPSPNLNAGHATRSTQNSSHVIMPSTYVIPTGNHLISSSNILNQEPTNYFGMGLSSFENSGTFGNFGEGPNEANQRADMSFEGMTGEFNIADINQSIQDVDAYGVNLWNTIN